ncbi:MAG: hypothetical protein KAT65_30395 [Methanophagales archaeon]|nr:hypothetical protein [Methanophagales archaeon]
MILIKDNNLYTLYAQNEKSFIDLSKKTLTSHKDKKGKGWRKKGRSMKLVKGSEEERRKSVKKFRR